LVRHGFIIENKEKYFLVINPKKEFSNGHTHLKSKYQAIYSVDCVYKKKIPRNTNLYFLVSLIRLSTDKEYIKEVEQLIETRKQKGKKDPYVVRRR
jgi:hypothetical protein